MDLWAPTQNAHSTQTLDRCSCPKLGDCKADDGTLFERNLKAET